MGSAEVDGESKLELDDSGCVQDESPSKPNNSAECSTNLLDLSDELLLYILKYCSPRDLKSLGFSCFRLGQLVRERSLWRLVNTCGECYNVERLKWLVTHVLHTDTRQLLINGYAKQSKGCLGILNFCRHFAEEEENRSRSETQDENSTVTPEEPAADSCQSGVSRECLLPRQHARLSLNAHRCTPLPRYRGSPAWIDEEDVGRVVPNEACLGPEFTVNQALLKQLGAKCPNLTVLALDYTNINYNTTNLSYFPGTIKKLSLRGTKCFNLAMDKSFLFKIQDYIPFLEYLDVSECEWLEPASLLPLSKLKYLLELYMRDCNRLAEFVAYASLAARYGFKKLMTWDLRGSPVGDSEVSALGWLPCLEELRLSAASGARAPRHSHHEDDVIVKRPSLLDDWELLEPECFKIVPECESNGAAGAEDLSTNETAETNDEPTDEASDDKRGAKRKTEDDEDDDSKKRKLHERIEASIPLDYYSKHIRVSHLITVNEQTNCTCKEKDKEPDKKPEKNVSNPELNAGEGTSKMNDGASTSKDTQNTEEFVCFRQNQAPVVVNLPREPEPEEPVRVRQCYMEPSHHVLYVNVGQQSNVYRLPSFLQGSIWERELRVFNVSQVHVDGAALVTDTAVRRFGRADGENINYVHIGNFPRNEFEARPDRSNLRRISMTGYRHITDRSLVHLATAAPNLEFVDFSETNVTAQGVETFRSLRPDCEVIFSPFVERYFTDDANP